MALAGAGCPSDGGSPQPGGTTTAPTSPPLTAPTLTTRPGTTGDSVTLTITDLRLVNSEESDNGLRVFMDTAGAPPDVAVVLTGGVPSPNRTIRVCPAVELETRVSAPGCATPASGEVVKVPHLPNYRGVEIVQVGVAAAGPGANSTAVGEIAITFPAATRQVRVRLPAVSAGDAGGRPAFKLTPPGPGSYRASAQWAPTATGTGEAELTLTTPTSTVSRAQGGPGTSLTGNLSPTGEAVIRFRNTGAAALTRVVLTVLFP